MSNSKRILVIDDEQDTVEMVETILSEIDGITTFSAYDGESGLAKAKETHPDLIILDVMMPEKNGFDVFADLKKGTATQDIPVIMLTGIADELKMHFSSDDMNNFLGSSPDAYIEKPVDASILRSTVLKIIG